MAGGLANFVLETATAPGTGSFMLNGPEAGRRSFSSAFQTGQGVFYFADDGNDAEWGLGVLTIGTPSTLARTTIIGSKSGSAQALNFTGTVEVYNEIPAERMAILEENGLLVVPTVQDFSKNYALPAAQADGRYVASTVGGGDPYNIQQFTRNSVSGLLGARTRDGVWHYVQPAGDYATSAALNTEAQRASTIESNLQSSKVSRDGDTMTGTLTQNLGTSAAVVASGMSGPATAGQSPWTPQFVSKSSNDGSLQAAFCARDRVGYYPYLSIQFTEQNGTWHELQFRSDNRLYTDNGNQFALTTELPTSGTIPGGTYTKTGNILQQHFTVGGVVHVDSGFWVSFPVAYSQTPQAIQLTANTGGDMDVSWFNASPTGFFIMIPYESATSNQPVSVLVSGIA